MNQYWETETTNQEMDIGWEKNKTDKQIKGKVTCFQKKRNKTKQTKPTKPKRKQKQKQKQKQNKTKSNKKKKSPNTFSLHKVSTT